jgi:hypothetical protein
MIHAHMSHASIPMSTIMILELNSSINLYSHVVDAFNNLNNQSNSFVTITDSLQIEGGERVNL